MSGAAGGRGGGARRKAASFAVFLLLPASLSLHPSVSAHPAPAGSSPSDPDANARCLACHGMVGLGYAGPAGLRDFSVSPAAFGASAHGGLACVQCHAGLADYPHDAAGTEQRATCDQDCHARDDSGRIYSHAAVAAELRESVHGGGGEDAPGCLTCHGGGDAHAVMALAAPTTASARAARGAACVACHDDRALMEKHDVTPDAVASYRRSFHSKAIRFGDARTAACPDCHTAHHVLPADDPGSTVAAANLPGTCGAAGCHEGAGRNFAVSGANHLDLRVEQEPILFVEETFFRVLTLGTMAMLLVGIVLDVQRSFGWLVLARRLGRPLASGLRALGPRLARTGRRGLRLARLLLVD